MRTLIGIATLAVAASASWAAERKVDPTWLRRHIPNVQPRESDITTPTCRYKPVFGEGDEDRAGRGIARYGEISVDKGGSSKVVTYPAEEQIYFVTEGEGAILYGEERTAIRKDDFLYIPPGVPHGLSNSSSNRLTVLAMGFRIPSGMTPVLPSGLQKANLADVPKQTVGGHPKTVLYQLMIGDYKSKRDKIAAANVVTSLYVMEFEPGGTNAPHHHEDEEEIYQVLDGTGDMVAGGGVDGREGRHSARAGDVYFFRMNSTVGFYASKEGGQKSRILAVRSLFPRRR